MRSNANILNERVFDGSPRDARALGACLAELSSLSRSTGCASVLRGRGGRVLATCDPSGRLFLAHPLSIESAVEEEDDDDDDEDGWFQAGSMIFVVHQGRTFSVLNGGSLAVAEVGGLPAAAVRLEADEVTPLMCIAADLCEAYVDDPLEVAGEPGEVA